MSISENIRQIRQNAGLTQEQFSIVAGVSPVAVSQWELGRSIPRMRSVDLIANPKVEGSIPSRPTIIPGKSI